MTTKQPLLLPFVIVTIISVVILCFLIVQTYHIVCSATVFLIWAIFSFVYIRLIVNGHPLKVITQKDLDDPHSPFKFANVGEVYTLRKNKQTDMDEIYRIK